jgi:hypothetical protein
MSDELEVVERTHSGIFIVLVFFAVVASLGALIWAYTLQNRIAQEQTQIAAAEQQENDKVAASLAESDARLRATTAAMAQSVGMTQKQLEARASDLLRRQQADAARLESEQAQARQQIGAVSGEVSNVKTDVGGVKTDVAQTKTELQSDEAQLRTMTGDLGVQSGRIATNAQELEVLKHIGDRNYYQFTLHRGAKPTPLAGVSLRLRKADPKHARYTMDVEADDRNIEKKDRGLNEPVQFYTGKNNLLYEVVVNNVEKNMVSGYLATPKNAPQQSTP